LNNNVVDVAIIGAGPYGLSIAAHLRSRGVAFRIFGSPMRFWLDMPKGIALKSPDFATNIYTPLPRYRFVDYCRERGIDTREPLDMSVFAEYGLWAQQELVPDVEDVQVCRLSRSNGSFLLTLASDEHVKARRVVVAVGLSYSMRMPAELEGLPPDMVTHTSQHRDYADFAGKDVTVIGRGQSAMEAAALLHEHGAQTRMLVRGGGIWFGDKMPERRPLLERIKNPQSVVGPGRLNWVLQQAKTLTYFLPEKKRVRLTKKHLGPFGTWWLRDQIEGKVPVLLRTHLVRACEDDGRVLLTVRDGDGERQFVTDHVVAGTGYEMAVDRIPFLAPELASSIDRIEKSPRLSRHFESSVQGLYFVGPFAAFSFGPLLRFVCGAEFTAPTVTRHLAKNRQR